LTVRPCFVADGSRIRPSSSCAVRIVPHPCSRRLPIGEHAHHAALLAFTSRYRYTAAQIHQAAVAARALARAREPAHPQVTEAGLAEACRQTAPARR
jgi:hypothetical protein